MNIIDHISSSGLLGRLVVITHGSVLSGHVIWGRTVVGLVRLKCSMRKMNANDVTVRLEQPMRLQLK